MIQLASLGILFCVVLACGFIACLPDALRHDFHLLHGPNDGCLECEDK